MAEQAPSPADAPARAAPDRPQLAPDGDRPPVESTGTGPDARAWVTPAIAALLAACFLGSIALGVDGFSPTSEQLLRVGASFGPALIDGEWWRLLTAELLHGGIVHLAFNLWALWGAGQFAERIYGKPAFVAIYLLSALGASVLSVAVAPLTVSIGASGAIFGVYGALVASAWFHGNPFPRAFLEQQRSSLIAFVGYNVLFAIVDRRIDAAGHAGGFAVGIALGILLRRDLRDVRRGGARRAGAVAATAAILAAAALGARARVAAVPTIRSFLLSREAAAALGAGQYELAAEKLGIAIAAADSWRARFLRALALGGLGRVREALDDAKIAADLAPGDVSGPLELRGSLEFRLGLTEDAARTCEAISKRAPWRGPDLRDRSVGFCAIVYAQRGDSKAALELADLLVGTDEGSSAALRVRAQVLMHMGRFDQAMADLDRVIEKEPKAAWALNARAWLRLGGEDFAGARTDADRAIAADPSSAAAMGTRCFVRAAVGEADDALRDCARAVELAPPGSLEDRGMLAFLSGDRTGALRLWREAAARGGNDSRVLAPWISRAQGSVE